LYSPTQMGAPFHPSNPTGGFKADTRCEPPSFASCPSRIAVNPPPTVFEFASIRKPTTPSVACDVFVVGGWGVV
jgi:hypothetical protein